MRSPLAALCILLGHSAYAQEMELPIPKTPLELYMQLTEEKSPAQWKVKQAGEIICDVLWWGPPTGRYYVIYATSPKNVKIHAIEMLSYIEHPYVHGGVTKQVAELRGMLSVWHQDGVWLSGSTSAQRSCYAVLAEHPDVVRLEHYFKK